MFDSVSFKRLVKVKKILLRCLNVTQSRDVSPAESNYPRLRVAMDVKNPVRNAQFKLDHFVEFRWIRSIGDFEKY